MIFKGLLAVFSLQPSADAADGGEAGGAAAGLVAVQGVLGPHALLLAGLEAVGVVVDGAGAAEEGGAGGGARGGRVHEVDLVGGGLEEGGGGPVEGGGGGGGRVCVDADAAGEGAQVCASLVLLRGRVVGLDFRRQGANAEIERVGRGVFRTLGFLTIITGQVQRRAISVAMHLCLAIIRPCLDFMPRIHRSH